MEKLERAAGIVAETMKTRLGIEVHPDVLKTLAIYIHERLHNRPAAKPDIPDIDIIEKVVELFRLRVQLELKRYLASVKKPVKKEELRVVNEFNAVDLAALLYYMPRALKQAKQDPEKALHELKRYLETIRAVNIVLQRVLGLTLEKLEVFLETLVLAFAVFP